jgi:Concanavalin A-like lectin/glucanases superfamily
MSSSIFITTVSATPVAPVSASPYTFGYNLGHYLSNSNASDWFNYSGANGARLFATPSRIYSAGSISTFNNTITSLTNFNNAKAAVRAAGENSTYINWDTYNTNIAAFTGINVNNYPNYIDLNYTLSDLNSKGTKTLINFDASINTFPILSSTDWSNMWLLWGNFYATSYLFAKNYNIKDWQMFNEPDLVGTNLPLSAWLLRLELTSDAIQSAVSDYNTTYSKSLSANVHAPVNSGGGSVRYTNSWGQSAIKTINTTYAGTINPNYFNFVTFDYHKYSTLTSTSGPSLGFIDDLSATKVYLTNDGFSNMPIAISEYSARDAGNYDSFVYTMDTAAEYLFVAADSVALACNGINEMYLYKFGQTYRSGVDVTYPVFKNGTYYVSNSGSAAGTYGGASQGAEVYRLFNKALAGNASIVYKSYVNTVSSTMMTYNPSLENYYIYVVNKTLGSIPLDPFYTTLPFSSFNTTSSPIFVEEVSQNCNGGGPLNNYLAFTELKSASLVPSQSVQLYTIPSRAVTITTLPSITAIQLNDGIYNNTTFTNNSLVSSTQIVQVSASNLTDVNGRSAALIKFNGLQGFYNNNNVQNAYLDLTITPSYIVSPAVAYWSLDNSSWLDSSGNGRTLINFNGVTNGTGLINGDAVFNGSNRLGTSSFGVNVNNDFSVSFWINATSAFNGNQHIFGAPFQNGLAILGGDSPSSSIRIGLFNGTLYVAALTPTLSLNTWYHIALTRSGNTLTAYLNGQQIGTTDVTGVNFPGASITSIGGGEYNQYYFTGSIDEAGIWDSALTPQQITRLYNNGYALAYNNFLLNIQAHVYGVTDNSWNDNSTWSSVSNILKQNIPAGTQIASNVVNNQGSTTTMLGQIVAAVNTGTYNAGGYGTVSFDVSKFVNNNRYSDSLSFLISQDHRWDIALPSLSAGDLQPFGINILGTGTGEQPTLTFITKKPAGLFFQYVYPQGSTNYVTYNFGTGSGTTANTILVDTLGTGMTATPISIGTGMAKVKDQNGLKVRSTSVGGWKDTIPKALAGNQFFYWTLSASNPSFNYINSFGNPSVYPFNVRRTVSGPQKAALLASSDPNFGSYSTLCDITLSAAGPNFSLTSSINSWFGNNVGVINYWPVYFRLVPYFNIGQGGSYYFALQHTGGVGTVDDLSIQYFTNIAPGTNVPSLSMT